MRSVRPLIVKNNVQGSIRLIARLSKELNVAPKPVVALNGLACAQFGLCDWEDAGKNLSTAVEALPLPLLVANLRALTVADENCKIAAQNDSPLFRPADFLDWESLQGASLKRDEPIRILVGQALPQTLTSDALDKMNAGLKNLGFYERVKDRIKSGDAPRNLVSLIRETEPYRSGKGATASAEELGRVMKLNRLVIEHLYPHWIAKHGQRDQGIVIGDAATRRAFGDWVALRFIPKRV